MKQPYNSFLGQFAAAKKELEEMPSWMKESAKVATLTYPLTKASVENSAKNTQKK